MSGGNSVRWWDDTCRGIGASEKYLRTTVLKDVIKMEQTQKFTACWLLSQCQLELLCIRLAGKGCKKEFKSKAKSQIFVVVVVVSLFRMLLFFSPH